MSKYITDEQGKWIIQGSARLLIEPSESYLAQRELERIQQEEEEANRTPPKEEALEQELANTNAMILELAELIMGGM